MKRNFVLALAALPDGSMAAGGQFLSAGGVATNHIARWNGSAWQAYGAGMDFYVAALAALPNGDLLAGGGFQTAGGLPARGIARWRGNSWTALGSGTNVAVTALAMQPAGEVVVVGGFTLAGGLVSIRTASLGSTCPASAEPLGLGCAHRGTTTALVATTQPWLGSTFRTRATRLGPNALASVVYGFHTLSLPMPSVHPLGQPGCVLRVDDDILLRFDLAAGAVDCQIGIPATTAVLGATFWHQVVPVELDAQNEIAALTATNALMLTVGSF